jgi:hypothetical protein
MEWKSGPLFKDEHMEVSWTWQGEWPFSGPLGRRRSDEVMAKFLITSAAKESSITPFFSFRHFFDQLPLKRANLQLSLSNLIFSASLFLFHMLICYWIAVHSGNQLHYMQCPAHFLPYI